MTDARPTAVVVLAAGEGKRMRSSVPKVLHGFAGRSLLGHALASAAPLGADETVVVVGAGRDAVTSHLATIAPAVKPVVQAEQRGTGHAVRVALDAVPRDGGAVVVLPGDAPLLRPETLRELFDQHLAGEAVATLLTSVVPDPTGYGRVVRDAGGAVTGVVEHRDASPAEREIAEVCTSAYVFETGALRAALSRLSTDNAQGEELLTEVVGLFVADGRSVRAVVAPADETAGGNDRVQLAAARRVYNDRVLAGWMRAGVTMLDPATTWVDADVVLAEDVTLEPGVQLHGRTRVETGAAVGPDCTLTDTVVEAGATVVRAHCVGAVVGPGATVGPFAYLRPGAVLGAGAKVGTYVEVKASELGPDAKIPHLSYVGNATIGAGSNLGAGTITANYDGVAKHHTTIGEHVRIGSDTVLVAPVTVGDGAYTAAGSVISAEVRAGELGVARAHQRSIPGWVTRRRAGTPSAGAAERAAARGEESGP